MLRPPLSAGLLLACSCAQFPTYPEYEAAEGRRGFLQGFVGVAEVETLDLGLAPGGDALADEDGSTMPAFGGVVGDLLSDPSQPLQIGVEGGFSTFWDSNRTSSSSGSGGALVTAETDVLFVDVFVGLALDLRLARRWRFYGGLGPVLSYGEIEVEAEGSTEELRDSGVGVGLYARAGLEFELYPGGWIGLGARWLDTRVDLGAGVDEVDLEATQLLFSATGRW